MPSPTERLLRPLLALTALALACNSAPSPGGDAGSRADTANPIAVADPELVEACDTLERWTRAAGARTLQRHDGQFTASVRGLPRWGCRLTASDSLVPETAVRPLDLVRDSLLAHGWRVEQDYVAESSDGAMTGLRAGTVVCVLQHYWDAHSDDERASVPTVPYAYHVQLECFREGPRSGR